MGSKKKEGGRKINEERRTCEQPRVPSVCDGC